MRKKHGGKKVGDKTSMLVLGILQTEGVNVRTDNKVTDSLWSQRPGSF